MPRRPSALPPTSSVFLRLPQQYATGVADKQIIPHEVPKCNRKLYSPVLSCTHHGKIPAAKSGFVCFADKIGFVFAFLVFYLFSIYLCRLFLYRWNPSGQSLRRKSRSWVRKPQRRGIWGGIWLDRHRADALRTRPNRGVSRGDRGGVRGWCRVGLRTTSCRRVKLIYWFFGLFLCENPVMLVFH